MARSLVSQQLLDVRKPLGRGKDHEALDMGPLGLGADLVLSDEVDHLALIGLLLEEVQAGKLEGSETPITRGLGSHFYVRRVVNGVPEEKKIST